MRLIERYILWRIAVLFIGTLTASLGIVWTTLVLGRFDFLTTSGQSFLSVIKFAGLLIPDAVPVAMPFAVVIAIANTLSTMNQDSELVVINAAGAPRSAVLRPVLMVAVVLSLASFGIENFLAPVADYQKREMLSTTRADLIGSAIEEDSFQKLDDNLYVEVGQRKSDGHLGGIFVADSRDPNIDLVYYAREGAVINRDQQSVLLMQDGEVQRRDVHTGNVSMIRFNSYAFDLGEFQAATQNVLLYSRERSLTDLLNTNPNDPMFRQYPQRFHAEVHKRLTDWVFPIVFALVSFLLAGDARSHRQTRMPAALTAISLSFVIFWLNYFAYGKARSSAAFVPLLYVTTFGIILVCAVMIASNRRLSIPRPVEAFGKRVTAAGAALLPLLPMRLRPGGGERG